jgi:hypothetical protein
VGPLTALTFVLLLDNNPSRFSKSRDLGCYFGPQPKQQDSGKYVSQLGITKAGDQLMRKLAVQCSHFMLGRFGRDSALRRWGPGTLPARWRQCKETRRCRSCEETPDPDAPAMEDPNDFRPVPRDANSTSGSIKVERPLSGNRSAVTATFEQVLEIARKHLNDTVA